MLLQTGIPKLDEMLDGGLKNGSSLLVSAIPGVKGLEFCQQILHTQLKNGRRAAYFVNDKKPSAVREMLRSYDWNVDSYEKKRKLVFIDAYSSILSQPSSEKFVVKNPFDIKDICDNVKKSATAIGSQLIFIFDNISTLFDECGTGSEVMSCIKDGLAGMKRNGVTVVCLFTEWPYEKELMNRLRAMFDYVLDLKAMEQKVIFRTFFSVSKGAKTTRDIPFKVLKPGGVRVYIPKILVTGPYCAGKTSFIHSASTRAVSVDRFGTTIALDHGHVDYKGFAADLFGTPGQERFDPILKLLGGESLGVIIVIDSSAPETFARAKQMMSITKTEGLPAIIVANKADFKGALKPAEIRRRMNLPKDIPIFPVVAADKRKIPKTKKPCALNKDGVNRVLEALFERVV
jgi:hypothetical protein